MGGVLDTGFVLTVRGNLLANEDSLSLSVGNFEEYRSKGVIIQMQCIGGKGGGWEDLYTHAHPWQAERDGMERQ